MDETKNIEIFVAIAKQELNLDWPGAWAEVLGAILENKIDSIIHYENNFNDKEKFQKNWMDTISEHHKLALKGRINFFPSWLLAMDLNENQFKIWLAERIKEKPEIIILNKSIKKLGKPTRRPEMIGALNRLYPNLDNLPPRKIMHKAVCAYLGQVVLEGGLYSFNAFKNALTDWKKVEKG